MTIPINLIKYSQRQLRSVYFCSVLSNPKLERFQTILESKTFKNALSTAGKFNQRIRFPVEMFIEKVFII